MGTGPVSEAKVPSEEVEGRYAGKRVADSLSSMMGVPVSPAGLWERQPHTPTDHGAAFLPHPRRPPNRAPLPGSLRSLSTPCPAHLAVVYALAHSDHHARALHAGSDGQRREPIVQPLPGHKWQSWSRVTEPSIFVKALCLNCSFRKMEMMLLVPVFLTSIHQRTQLPQNLPPCAWLEKLSPCFPASPGPRLSHCSPRPDRPLPWKRKAMTSPLSCSESGWVPLRVSSVTHRRSRVGTQKAQASCVCSFHPTSQNFPRTAPQSQAGGSEVSQTTPLSGPKSAGDLSLRAPEPCSWAPGPAPLLWAPPPGSEVGRRGRGRGRRMPVSAARAAAAAAAGEAAAERGRGAARGAGA
ncbi:PREDICTED: uncharacterized protein LOC106503257 [Capra hircus]|uniref:uncharacterized protein LOC106503257 n=1 Tax=Capra hircus TaxID=9925 RepID=UPI000846E3F2|nr:PREDICTED: uncharacterized protein LOC106503257 [Capra hircus]